MNGRLSGKKVFLIVSILLLISLAGCSVKKNTAGSRFITLLLLVIMSILMVTKPIKKVSRPSKRVIKIAIWK